MSARHKGYGYDVSDIEMLTWLVCLLRPAHLRMSFYGFPTVQTRFTEWASDQWHVHTLFLI
jgi:hypothetical protein